MAANLDPTAPPFDGADRRAQVPALEADLAELAAEPRARWPVLVRERFADDPGLAAQALVWLEATDAGATGDESRPVLGEGSERYALGVLLDVGATASVWQARDTKLGRDVAIKVFRVERTPALLEILAEARAACEVISDHVVRVLDVQAGAPASLVPAYLVMELVGEHEPRRGVLTPGASAATMRPASLDEAVRWVRDVSRGVHDAHLRNVFHRDLKPHNVLITPVSRRARIADFGLAISAARTDAGPARNRIAGTPAYIAPEQARGLRNLDPRDVDERAALIALDVWGLGAVAYDLASGRPPWQPRAGLDAWEVAAAGDAPPRLTAIPRRLRRVIDRALALDPRARYASAGELADDLDAYLARRPTSHDRVRAARFALWCRRNPQLAVAALIAVALAALAIVAYVNVVEVRDQRNTLSEEVQRATIENDQLEQRAAATRSKLTSAEADLEATSASLDLLKKTLADANKDYRAIVAAKQRALETADEATRLLAEELSSARNEGEVARTSAALYQGFWERARSEADQATRDHDTAVQERDTARKERDQTIGERDALTTVRAQLEKERDAAITERDRAEAARRRAELDIARLASQVAALTAPDSARAGSGSGSGAAVAVGTGTGTGSGSGSGSGSAVPTTTQPDARADAHP